MARPKCDLTGQKYGRLTVIKESEPKNNKRYWDCRCECGNEKTVEMNQLRQGKTKSCGCLHKEKVSQMSLNDLTGKRFGKLTVLQKSNKTDKKKQVYFDCECDCGNTKAILGSNLSRGITKSCGCARTEAGKRVKEHHEGNLRVDGVLIPSLNRKRNKNNAIGIKGVSPYKTKRGIKYRAFISVDNVPEYLGTYTTVKEAVDVRKKAEEVYHKPYIDKLKEITKQEKFEKMKMIHPVVIKNDNFCNRKRMDLTGHVYGMLSVIYETTPRKTNRYWVCKCECGDYTVVQQAHLRNGTISSCGCKRKRHENLIGQKFNKLTVIARGKYKKIRGSWMRWWVCECKCGNTTEVLYLNLKSGRTKSCGCLKIGRKKSKDNRRTRGGKYIGYIRK